MNGKENKIKFWLKLPIPVNSVGDNLQTGHLINSLIIGTIKSNLSRADSWTHVLIIFFLI